jgi:DNA repair exonuclease SbcCD ATPase subunit
MDDVLLPKDQAEAQQFLIALEKKDQDKTLCSYPTCKQSRRSPPEGGGNIPAYCDDEAHTSLSNSRLRANIKKLANGLKAPKLETEQPVTTKMVQVLEEKALVQMKRFHHDFGLYVAAIEEIADPDITSAQIEAAQFHAEAQIASIQEAMKTEQAFRKSAENLRDTAQAARDAAQQDAQAARGETALVRTKLQQSEEQIQFLKEQHEQEVASRKQEHAAELEALQRETQKQIEAIRDQAKKDIASAQEKTDAAQRDANGANIRAHDAETKATIEIASAEQRVKEAQNSLKREQDEVAQLRQARDATTVENKKRAEADLKERERLRTELTTVHQRTENDQKEIERVRDSRDRAIERADELARLNDTLRTQLLQIQMGGQEKPEN